MKNSITNTIKVCLHLNILISIVYLFFRYFLKKDGSFGPESYRFQIFLQYAHIILVPFMVFAFGQLWATHVMPKVRSGNPRKKKSGFTMICLLILVTLTGYLIQLPFTEWMNILGYSHSLIGVVFIIIFYWHSRA